MPSCWRASGLWKIHAGADAGTAMNCLESPITDGLPDFCGKCANCVRIGQADDLAARFAEAVEARENLRETDKKETRILVQTHPDVLVIPPDPPQMMIKVDQVRRVIESIYYRPAGGTRTRLHIHRFGLHERGREFAAEESWKSRRSSRQSFCSRITPASCFQRFGRDPLMYTLSALPTAEIEEHLAKTQPNWNAKQRALVARLAEGAVGRAQAFDLEEYTAARNHALAIVTSALRGSDHSELFKVTESYRPGADGRAKIEQLIRTIYSILQDMMFLQSNTPELVRNSDITAELKRLNESADFEWIASRLGPLG